MLQFANKRLSVVVNEMDILHKFLLLIGMAPLNFKKRFSCCNYLHSIFVLCVMIGINLTGLRECFAYLYLLKSPLYVIATTLGLICLMIGSWLIIICSFVRFRIYENAFVKLIEIDALFTQLYMKTSTCRRGLKCLIFAFLFCLFMVSIDTFFIKSSGSSVAFLIPFTKTHHVSFTIIVLIDCFVKTVFEQLKIRFQLINEYFSDSLKFDKMYHTKKIFVISQQYVTKTKIKELARIHCNLIKITRKFNNFFSPLLLLEITVFFTATTSTAYIFFYLLTNETKFTQRKSIIMMAAFWTIALFVKLSTLLRSSIELMKQANTTSHLVHAILINGSNTGAYKELEILGQHLVHEKLQITACGFFPVDCSLLHGMITASTTYLIILIQFQISTDDSR